MSEQRPELTAELALRRAIRRAEQADDVTDTKRGRSLRASAQVWASIAAVLHLQETAGAQVLYEQETVTQEEAP